MKSILIHFAAFLVLITLFLGGLSPVASAKDATQPTCNGTSATPESGKGSCVVCGTGNNSVQCDAFNNAKDCNASNGCNLVAKYIQPLINTLAVVVGLLSVVSIMIGGVQFASSDGDPQKAAAAKGRIAKTIIALVSFMFLYALLQFLVPGGIFNK